MTLAGRTVFLSASVPSLAREAEYQRIPDAAQQIDHAVVSLCRALFSRGGVIVFGGHPSISPLVALVAAEYAGAETSAQPMVHIYQSRIFEGHLPDETLLMYRMGYAELHWIKGAPGEKFYPRDPTSLLRIGGSLKAMREAMIGETSPVGMVAIGGMKGVLDEAEIFQRMRQHPIFVLESTGGASLILAERGGERIRVYDREIRQRLGDAAPTRTPYGLIAELLADELDKLPIT